MQVRKMRATMMMALILVATCFQNCGTDEKVWKAKSENPEFIHRTVRKIIDIMRHDIFAPPVASRIYAYSTIAAYEAMRHGFQNYPTLAGKLNELSPVPEPDASKSYCFPLAGTTAMLVVGQALIFTEADMAELKAELHKEFDEMGMPKDVFERSVEYGNLVAKHIQNWSKSDNYAQTRSAPKFTIVANDPARWVPTPPMYNDALEPHWRTIRPWVMDSAGQFLAEPPYPFSTDKESDFFKAALEVYEISKNLTDEQRETGFYWDDNPFEVSVSGHLTIGIKKISPASHWMNIASHAARRANAGIMEATKTYTYMACAMADAFISCWNAKYTYNLLRPVTYINLYIDPDWQPLIETPPFPEHTSGHATVSNAAAAVLTKTYGESFQFIDSTEVEFGMSPRAFNSFFEASEQVAISRLYGGIHYRRGNEVGTAVGRKLGNFVFAKLDSK